MADQLPDARKLNGRANFMSWMTSILALLGTLNLAYYATHHEHFQAGNLSSNHQQAVATVILNIGDVHIADQVANGMAGQPLHAILAHLTATLSPSVDECMSDLHALRFEPGEPVAKFLSRGQSILSMIQRIARIRNNAPIMDERAFLLLMLHKLPSTFNDAIMQIQTWHLTHGGVECPVSTALTILAGAQAVYTRALPNSDEAGPSNRPSSKRPHPNSTRVNGTTSYSAAAGGFGADHSDAAGPQNLQNAGPMAALFTAINSLTSSLRSTYRGPSHRGRGRGRGVYAMRGGRGGGRGSGYRGDGNHDHSRYSAVQCWTCNEFGHLAKDCPRRGPPPPPSGGAGEFGSGGSGSGNAAHSGSVGGTRQNPNSQRPHPITPTCLATALYAHSFSDVGITEFLLDSGATAHITHNKSLLHDFRPAVRDNQKVITGSGSLSVAGSGSVTITVPKSNHSFTINEVLYVPLSPVNIFSTAQLNAEGGTFFTTKSRACLTNSLNKTLTTRKHFQGIYLLQGVYPCHAPERSCSRCGWRLTRMTPLGTF
jgi:hypothetical protein